MPEKKDICSLTYEELVREMEAAGEKKFRAGQICQWLHVKLAYSFGEMTNLSVAQLRGDDESVRGPQGKAEP